LKKNVLTFSTKDFYHFQAALTRQKLRGGIETGPSSKIPEGDLKNFSIPIKQCWYKLHKWKEIVKGPTKIKAPGLIQIWEEMTVEDHKVRGPKNLKSPKLIPSIARVHLWDKTGI